MDIDKFINEVEGLYYVSLSSIALNDLSENSQKIISDVLLNHYYNICLGDITIGDIINKL